jgi:hypothetical protein
MCVSTFSQNERRAVFTAVLLILVVTAGPYELAFALSGNSVTGSGFALSENVLAPSPVFAFTIAQSTGGALQAGALYGSLVQTHAIAWALLGLSCAMAPHLWQDRPQGRRRERWNRGWRRWRLGTEVERAAFRRRLLARNPCFWLSSR